MATKDWKDISMVGKGWTFKKKLNVLQITGYGWTFPKHFMVRVFQDAGWTSENVIFHKDTNSLIEARKVAKQYMRTH